MLLFLESSSLLAAAFSLLRRLLHSCGRIPMKGPTNLARPIDRTSKMKKAPDRCSPKRQKFHHNTSDIREAFGRCIPIGHNSFNNTSDIQNLSDRCRLIVHNSFQNPTDPGKARKRCKNFWRKTFQDQTDLENRKI